MVRKPFLILDKEFIDFCKLNDIADVEAYGREVFTKGFTMVKYGDLPFTTPPKEVVIEKEVIVEKVVVDDAEVTRLLTENAYLKERILGLSSKPITETPKQGNPVQSSSLYDE
jgi:hypothetical protein